MNTLNFSQTKPKQEILIIRNNNSKTRFDVVKVDYKQQQIDYLEKDMEYEQAVDSCKWFKGIYSDYNMEF